MLRFLYGLICLICLIIVVGAIAAWVYSDGLAGLGKTYTHNLNRYQLEGNLAQGKFTGKVTAGYKDDQGVFHAVNELAASSQPAAASQPVDLMPRWTVGPAKFNCAEVGTAEHPGKMYFLQAPYYLIAAVFALPLLIWVGLPRKRKPYLCRACQANLRGSPAHCRACGQAFVVAQY
jgi:hypothetical protein